MPQYSCACLTAAGTATAPPPFPQAYLPANTIASFFGGKASNAELWKPVGSAPLCEYTLFPEHLCLCVCLRAPEGGWVLVAQAHCCGAY
jgi:hypothetical protein